MKWILMAIGYLFVDINTWSLPPMNFFLTQVGCVCLFVAGSFPNGGWHD